MFVDGYSRYVLNIKVSPYDGSRLVLEQWAALSRARGYIMPSLFRTDKVDKSDPNNFNQPQAIQTITLPQTRAGARNGPAETLRAAARVRVLCRRSAIRSRPPDHPYPPARFASPCDLRFDWSCSFRIQPPALTPLANAYLPPAHPHTPLAGLMYLAGNPRRTSGWRGSGDL